MVFTAQSRSHIVCSKETQRWWSGTWEKLSWKQKMKNGSILAVPRRANRISLGTCEKAAENSAFGTCFRHPFHHTPTRTSGRFNLFLGSSAPSAQRASTVIVAHVFDIHSHSPSPPPPLSQRDLFWLHELCPQNGPLSTHPAHHGSRCI